MRIKEGAPPDPTEHDVFFAHYGKDTSAALQLCERLRDYNLQVWEYSSAPQVGGVSNDVHNAIGRSRIAVFCVSDEVIQRDWFKAEQSAARQAIGVDRIFFVKVGALAHHEAFLAADLPEKARNLIDLSDPSNEREYDRFLQSICHKLGAVFPPITIAAALITLTKEEFHDVFRACTLNGGQTERLTALVEHCRRIGMGRHVATIPQPADGESLLERTPDSADALLREALESDLAQRYGASVEDFAPFVEQPLIALVSEVIRMINARRGDGRRLHLKWLHRDLTSSDQKVRREAQAEWSSTNTLAVIDSVALLSERLAKCVDSILNPPGLSPTAVIWVPPDTRHLAGMARRSIAEVTDRLALWFRDLDKHPDRSLAFDMSDPASLRHWLHQAISSLVLAPQAVNAAHFAQGVPHPNIHPRTFMGGG